MRHVVTDLEVDWMNNQDERSEFPTTVSLLSIEKQLTEQLFEEFLDEGYYEREIERLAKKEQFKTKGEQKNLPKKKKIVNSRSVDSRSCSGCNEDPVTPTKQIFKPSQNENAQNANSRSARSPGGETKVFKTQIAEGIFLNNYGKIPNKDVITLMINQCNLSKAGATTYFYNMKNKFFPKQKPS